MDWGAFLRRSALELGKMRTAVGLLALCALASLLATVLPQGLPIQDYVARYGARWAWWLDLLGLTDVVRAWWFLGILVFLLVSVSVCLARHAPAALRRLTVRRAGYLLVHAGMLGVAAGGLLTGLVGWRGVMNLREGETDRMVLVFGRSKVTAHRLPFEVTNEHFDIEQYANGMPKRFATQLGVRGRPGVTVEVNRPVTIDGYTFYQAGFGDGGSTVKGDGLNVRGGTLVPFVGKVHEVATLADGTRVELLDFRDSTVESMVDETGKRLPPVDVGPSLDYLVQPPDAPARQLRSYLMHPAILGVAEKQDDEGKVMYGPVWLGIVEPQLWPVVAQLARLPQTDLTVGEGLVAFKRVAGPALAQLPEERRVSAGLGVMQAVKMVRGLGLTHLIFAHDYLLRRYTGLQVAYDPGAVVFWPSALLGVLGVLLMFWGARKRD